MKKLKLSELVLDYELYPRSEVSDTHVRRLADVIRSGKKLPPIVVQEGTYRTIDGFHRIKAYKICKIEDVQCDIIKCNDVEAYKLAVEYNNSHGRPFTPFDYQRIILKFDKLGISRDNVADLLNIRLDKIKEIKKSYAVNSGGELIPLKKSIIHMAGRRLTKQQEEVNDDLSGMPVSFWVSQLTKILQSNLWEHGNEELNNKMDALCDLWEKVKDKVI